MKSCNFLLTVSIAITVANSVTTENHVRQFFQLEHRKFLRDTTSFEFAKNFVAAAQDESTKCLSICEPKCDKLEVPDYLTENASFFQFQHKPADCVLASTVVLNWKDRCTWLYLYFFDCCRDCNAKHYKCREKFPGDNGSPECYRDHYWCMHRCQQEHEPPDTLYPPP